MILLESEHWEMQSYQTNISYFFTPILHKVKYLIPVQHLKRKLFVIWLAKKDNLMQLMLLSINLNAQHVNGKTHFYFAIYSGKLSVYLVEYQIKTFLNALSLR